MASFDKALHGGLWWIALSAITELLSWAIAGRVIITVLINTTVVSVWAYGRLGLFFSLSLARSLSCALCCSSTAALGVWERERDGYGGSEEGIWPVWTEKQKKKERRVREGPPVWNRSVFPTKGHQLLTPSLSLSLSLSLSVSLSFCLTLWTKVPFLVCLSPTHL